MLANTAPVVFGSIGIPVVTLAFVRYMLESIPPPPENADRTRAANQGYTEANAKSFIK
jgi:hypothetical protein